MALKYGPPGITERNKDYFRHKAYCFRTGVYVDWEGYLNRPRSMYGYRGCSKSEQNSHKCFCNKHKRYFTWLEYSTDHRRHKDQPVLTSVASALKAKVQALGLMPKQKAL